MEVLSKGLADPKAFVLDRSGGQFQGRGSQQEGEREQADGLRVVVGRQVAHRQVERHQGKVDPEGAGGGRRQ